MLKWRFSGLLLCVCVHVCVCVCVCTHACTHTHTHTLTHIYYRTRDNPSFIFKKVCFQFLKKCFPNALK